MVKLTTKEANAFKTASLQEKGNKLAFVCLCFFVFDVSISGSGRYLMIGPFSPRMIAALLAFFLCVPKFLKEFSRYVSNRVLWMFALFWAYLLVCTVRGLFGNGRMNVLISDLKGFAWLFIVPTMMAVVVNRTRFQKLLTVILAGALVQAVVVLSVNALCIFVFQSSQPLEDMFNKYRIGLINFISAKFYRLFMSSCPYMVFGCAIAVFRQAQERKIKRRYVVSIALLLSALLISFTRSVYGCVFVVAFCACAGLVCFYGTEIKKHLRFLAVTIAATCCLIFALEFVFNANYFNFALSRTFGISVQDSMAMKLRQAIDEWDSPDAERIDALQIQQSAEATGSPVVDAGQSVSARTKQFQQESISAQKEYMALSHESDDIRAETKRELMALIAKNPLFGNGLGACADVRDDGLDEYFYLDMLARTGIVGLLLYILPFVWIVKHCLREKARLVKLHGAVAVLCGMTGFWAITWFNPWMNAVLGITAYALCCTLPQLIHQEQEPKK